MLKLLFFLLLTHRIRIFLKVTIPFSAPHTRRIFDPNLSVGRGKHGRETSHQDGLFQDRRDAGAGRVLERLLLRGGQRYVLDAREGVM